MKVYIDSIHSRMTPRLISYLRKTREVIGVNLRGKQNLSKNIKTVELDSPADFSPSPRSVLLFGSPAFIEEFGARDEFFALIPSPEMVSAVTNKDIIKKRAESLGIKVPQIAQGAEFPEGEETPKGAEMPEGAEFPAVIKLRNSEGTMLKPADRYRIVRNPKELNAAAAHFDGRETLIEQYIEGAAVGASLLLDRNSNLVDYIMHERILEYPIDGGPSAICRTVHNKKLLTGALKLLQSVGWRGLAMVEFKGGHFLEINPRFWGSMPLALVSGSKIFDKYIEVSAGGGILNSPVNLQYKIENPEYRLGAGMHYFPQSLIGGLKLIGRAEAGRGLKCLGLSAIYPEGVFSFKNPAPFFRYLGGLLKR